MSNGKIENLDLGLFVGVENYRNQTFIPEAATGAKENATKMENLVREICNEANSRLTFTTIVSGDEDTPPTFENIRHELESLREKSPPICGRLFFYFCGHGAINSTREDLLLPEDVHEGGTTFSVDDLIKYFSCLPFEQVILMIDACRNVLGDKKLEIYSLASAADKTQCERTLVMQATRSGERAWADQDLEAGLFTSSVLEVFNYDPDLRQYRLPDKYLNPVPALRARCLLPKTLGILVDALINKHLENRAYQTPEFRDNPGLNPTIALARVDDPKAEQHKPGLEFERFFAIRLSQMGFEDLVTALWKDLDQAKDVVFLFPDETTDQQQNGQIPIKVAMWLIEHVLLRRRERGGDFQTIQLTAPGMPLQDVNLDEQRAIRVSESRPVFYGLYLNSGVTSESLKEFFTKKWLPFIKKYQVEKKRFEKPRDVIGPTGEKLEVSKKMHAIALVVIAESQAVKAVFEKAVGGQPYPTHVIPEFGAEDLKNWIARFRHDLPLTMVYKREETARQIADPPKRFDHAIEDLIDNLKSDTPPWEADFLI